MLRKLLNTEDQDNNLGPVVLSAVISAVIALLDLLLLL